MLERDWDRWGALLFLQLKDTLGLGHCGFVRSGKQAGGVGCFFARKGLGALSKTRCVTPPVPLPPSAPPAAADPAVQ